MATEMSVDFSKLAGGSVGEQPRGGVRGPVKDVSEQELLASISAASGKGKKPAFEEDFDDAEFQSALSPILAVSVGCVCGFVACL